LLTGSGGFLRAAERDRQRPARITPSTALRLAKALGTSAQFWLNGQLALDLYNASHDERELRELERLEPISH
jgi:plasmid maintenance system antidote protein VapI